MYKILAFENGQPIIFYHNGENVYMYTALRGHLHAEGLLFNDVKQDFEVYDGDKKYLYYISTDNKIKLASLTGNKFTEFLSIPLEDKEHGSTIVNVSPVMCENELYIFYCSHNQNSNRYDIYYLICSSPNHTCLIKRNVENSEDFDVLSSKQKTYIILKNDCYYLSKNGKKRPVNCFSKAVIWKKYGNFQFKTCPKSSIQTVQWTQRIGRKVTGGTKKNKIYVIFIYFRLFPPFFIATWIKVFYNLIIVVWCSFMIQQ